MNKIPRNYSIAIHFFFVIIWLPNTCWSADKVVVIPLIDSSVAALEARVAQLEALLAGVIRENNTIKFSGVNVQVDNGTGSSDGQTNGLGNLFIGYNEKRDSGDDKTGSHNLILGELNNYKSFGGIVSGVENVISGEYSTVISGNKSGAIGDGSISSGTFNAAIGVNSVVIGGSLHTASGIASCITGGLQNTASGGGSTINGGYLNKAIFSDTTISGGSTNTASGRYASISGGASNTASGPYSSISGGASNTASGEYSSVTGGRKNKASGLSYPVVTGGLSNTASGTYGSSVTGGQNNTASGDFSSVSGGDNRSATGFYDWAAGSQFEDR